MNVQKGIKDRVIFILYNLIIIIVFLGIAEGTASYLLHHPDKIPSGFLKAFRAYYTEHLRSTIQMEPESAIYDPELFYTLRPGKSTFKNLEYETTVSVNSKGIRDDEESLDYPEIILLGDSFTMGWGVDQDSTFEKQLENLIQVKVLNAGISSYGTVRELKLLKRLPIDSIKLILIQYHDSDKVENKEFMDRGDTLLISSKESYEKTSQNVRNRVKYYFGKHTSLLLKLWLKDKLGRMTERTPTGKDDAKYFINVLEKMSLPKDIPIVVFEISSYGNESNLFVEALNNELMSHPALSKHITTLSIQSYLNPNDYFIIDDHINNHGHKRVAETLSMHLSKIIEKN